jgi:hypothetical protein
MTTDNEWNAAIEAAAKHIERGSFLHDDAPDARFAKEAAKAIRSLKRQSFENKKNDIDVEEVDRLLKTIKYIIGIAERGEGRAIREDETVEAFVLGYVKKLQSAKSSEDKAMPQEHFNSTIAGLSWHDIDCIADQCMSDADGLDIRLFARKIAILSRSTPVAQPVSGAVANAVDEKEAFEKWFAKRGVWPRITYEEAFIAGHRATPLSAPSTPQARRLVSDDQIARCFPDEGAEEIDDNYIRVTNQWIVDFARNVATLTRPFEEQDKEIKLNIIRFWPEGMNERLDEVFGDLIGFIPNYKLYDLQRVLAEFGFTMKVYENAAQEKKNV